jgi:hypothetical protein
MRERDFQAQVVELAKLRGWKVAWTWNSLHSPKGWPDLVLCRGHRLLHAELKTERGKLTAPQAEWLMALASLPGEVYVWRPSHWKQIERVLDIS